MTHYHSLALLKFPLAGIAFPCYRCTPTHCLCHYMFSFLLVFTLSTDTDKQTHAPHTQRYTNTQHPSPNHKVYTATRTNTVYVLCIPHTLSLNYSLFPSLYTTNITPPPLHTGRTKYHLITVGSNCSEDPMNH